MFRTQCERAGIKEFSQSCLKVKMSILRKKSERKLPFIEGKGVCRSQFRQESGSALASQLKRVNETILEPFSYRNLLNYCRDKKRVVISTMKIKTQK